MGTLVVRMFVVQVFGLTLIHRAWTTAGGGIRRVCTLLGVVVLRPREAILGASSQTGRACVGGHTINFKV